MTMSDAFGKVGDQDNPILRKLLAKAGDQDIPSREMMDQVDNLDDPRYVMMKVGEITTRSVCPSRRSQ